jgi:hypothetical protein
MRTATTDEHARRWFRGYWTFGVGSGAHIRVNGLLDVARDHRRRGPRGEYWGRLEVRYSDVRRPPTVNTRPTS